MYFLGYLVVLGGLAAALWKLGVEWVAIGLVIALGIGIMAAVSIGGGDKRTIEIDRSDY